MFLFGTIQHWTINIIMCFNGYSQFLWIILNTFWKIMMNFSVSVFFVPSIGYCMFIPLWYCDRKTHQSKTVSSREKRRQSVWLISKSHCIVDIFNCFGILYISENVLKKQSKSKEWKFVCVGKNMDRIQLLC